MIPFFNYRELTLPSFRTKDVGVAMVIENYESQIFSLLLLFLKRAAHFIIISQYSRACVILEELLRKSIEL